MSERRFTRWIWLLIWGAASSLPAAAQTAQTASDILAAADRVRNPAVPFRVTNKLTEFRNGKVHDSATLIVYSKLLEETGQFRNLSRYVEPSRDAGKSLLMKDATMWFYDPASKTSVRISPQQRLVGQASNGDVVSVNLSKDYDAELSAEESIIDADKTNRDTWHLLLKASTPSAFYLKIDYWVEKQTYRPVKAKFYSDSGRLLKIAFYRAFASQLGGVRPTEVVILDEIDKSVVTRMNFSNFQRTDIPERWFQRDYLPVFSGGQ